MSVTATDADLEQQIAEQRREAEAAMAMAERLKNGTGAAAWRDKARNHYAHMAGLISMRSDERVEQMERERGLR